MKSSALAFLEQEEIRALRREAARLLGINEPQRALTLLERTLALDPQDAITHAELGNVLQALQRLPEALEAYGRSLALRPDLVAALVNRSNVFRALKRFEEALSDLSTALQAKPSFPEALNNQGNVLRDVGRLEEALLSFDRALLIKPGFPMCLCNRGNTLLDLGRPQDALSDFETALQQSPEEAEARFGRASALLRLDLRLEEAVADFERAQQLGLDPVECLVGRSTALANLDRHHEAAVCLASLLELAPDREYVRGGLVHSLRQAGHWELLGPLTEELTRLVQEGRKATPPQSLLSLVDAPELHQMCARTFATDRYPENRELGPPRVRARAAHERLRVAYISADFREHPVSYLLVGVLEQHDRKQLEVIGVSLGAARGGAFEQRVWQAFDRFIDVTQLTDRDAAQMLRELEVDVAVDLMGYTQGGRLGILAHRIAPVQVSYLGYASTLAAPYIDYLLADAVAVPPEEERWYSERVVRLPHCYLPYDDRRELSPAPTRLQAGLPPDGFVFCAFTNIYKIAPEIFTIWMQLLTEVPRSVLWLSANSLEARANLQRHAQQRGVEPERLVFAPHVADVALHLARQQLVDLYLDTLPYNAHSTACDALWAGVPVLTCAGRSLAARAAASAVTAAGLPELITRSLEEYKQKALTLARDPSALAAVKERLAKTRRNAPLFDTARFSRHLEAAYREMHARAARGEPAASFSVPATMGASK
jgi:predicted O-linked N-acetylglucosamine transferase (SPINDLY family)